MKAPRLLGCACLVALVGYAGEVDAEDSYDAPLFGATVAYGARSGWGGGDAAVVGGGLFGGGRWAAFRAGVSGQARWWRADPGVAVDGGAFISYDPGSIWLDPELSAAWFVRVEPVTFRWVSSTSLWA